MSKKHRNKIQDQNKLNSIAAYQQTMLQNTQTGGQGTVTKKRVVAQSSLRDPFSKDVLWGQTPPWLQGVAKKPSKPDVKKPIATINENPKMSGTLAPALKHDDPNLPSEIQVRIRAALEDAKKRADGYAAKADFVFLNTELKDTIVNFHDNYPWTTPKTDGSHRPMDAKITQRLPGDMLNLMASMNVSDHDLSRNDALIERAKSNTYAISITRPDGSSETMRGISANGNLVTAQDVSIQLQPGENVILMWPEATSPYGYDVGRKLVIDYDYPGAVKIRKAPLTAAWSFGGGYYGNTGGQTPVVQGSAKPKDNAIKPPAKKSGFMRWFFGDE